MRGNLALVLIASALLAQPLAAQRLQGPEITVNSMPGVVPRASQVARAANGDTVVVWTGRLSSGADRVWMRRFSAAGKPQGPRGSRRLLRRGRAAGSSPDRHGAGRQFHGRLGHGRSVLPQRLLRPLLLRQREGAGIRVPARPGQPGPHRSPPRRRRRSRRRLRGHLGERPHRVRLPGLQSPRPALRREWPAARPPLQDRGSDPFLPELSASHGERERRPSLRLGIQSERAKPRVSVPAAGPAVRRRGKSPGRPSPGDLRRSLELRRRVQYGGGRGWRGPLHLDRRGALSPNPPSFWASGAPPTAHGLAGRSRSMRRGGRRPVCSPGNRGDPGRRLSWSGAPIRAPKGSSARPSRATARLRATIWSSTTAQYEAQPAVAIGRDGVGVVTWTTISFRRNRSALLLRRFVP